MSEWRSLTLPFYCPLLEKHVSPLEPSRKEQLTGYTASARDVETADEMMGWPKKLKILRRKKLAKPTSSISACSAGESWAASRLEINRAASISANCVIRAGCAPKIGSRCSLLISTSVTGEAVTTVALRGAPVSRDISPNTAPGCSRPINRVAPVPSLQDASSIPATTI